MEAFSCNILFWFTLVRFQFGVIFTLDKYRKLNTLNARHFLLNRLEIVKPIIQKQKLIKLSKCTLSGMVGLIIPHPGRYVAIYSQMS